MRAHAHKQTRTRTQTNKHAHKQTKTNTNKYTHTNTYTHTYAQPAAISGPMRFWPHWNLVCSRWDVIGTIVTNVTLWNLWVNMYHEWASLEHFNHFILLWHMASKIWEEFHQFPSCSRNINISSWCLPLKILNWNLNIIWLAKKIIKIIFELNECNSINKYCIIIFYCINYSSIYYMPYLIT